MKKSSYILILVFLISGNGFGFSLNISNTFGVHSTKKLLNSCTHIHKSSSSENNLINIEIEYDNYFCKTPSVKCVEYTYLMNSESKEHTNCAKIYYLYKKIKTVGNWSKYKNSIALLKKTNSESLVESSSIYAPPVKIIINKLQNVNLEEYYSLQIDPSYYRGFGVRFSI